MKTTDRYLQRGVSASKEDVHKAIEKIDKGLFPKAFCKIVPDILTGDPEYNYACRWRRNQDFARLSVLERNG
jgi:hypothetical protein